MRQTSRAQIQRWDNESDPTDSSDELATEEPLEIRAAGEPITVTMRTPGHDIELVTGMLLTEGLLTPGLVSRQEQPNVVNVALAGGGELDHLRRSSVMSTSCGLCGKGSIEAVHRHFLPLEDDVTISRSVLAQMLDCLDAAQPAFARTGGLHAATLFDSGGALLVAREDVGRHNAVDKVIGHAVLRGRVPLTGHVLLVSGRVSFEIVQKALGARIPIIAAVSAPSSLAVDFADANGQTLIGFLRPGRFNVYTHFERVVA